MCSDSLVRLDMWRFWRTEKQRCMRKDAVVSISVRHAKTRAVASIGAAGVSLEKQTESTPQRV